jgi:hypothetical protein
VPCKSICLQDLGITFAFEMAVDYIQVFKCYTQQVCSVAGQIAAAARATENEACCRFCTAECVF